MRVVGRRKERPVSFFASAAILAEGARFNGDLHRLPSGQQTFVRKGIHRFRSADEASRHERDSLVLAIAHAARGE